MAYNHDQLRELAQRAYNAGDTETANMALDELDRMTAEAPIAPAPEVGKTEQALAAAMNPVQAGIIGAGEALKGAQRGAAGLISHGVEAYANLSDNPELAEEQIRAREIMRQEAESEAQAVDPLRQEQPIGMFAGGIAPFFALPAAGLGGTIGTGAAIGGTMAGSQELGGAALGAGLGAGLGGLGYGAGAVLSRAIGGPKAMQGSRGELIKRLEDEGYKFTPAQKSGGAVQQRLEASLESLPGGGAGIDKIRAQTQKAINQQAARAIGEESSELSSEVLGRAERNIGKMYKDALEDVQLHPGADLRFQNEFNAVKNAYERVPGRSHVTDNIIYDLEKEFEKATVNGKRFHELSRMLRKRGKDFMKQGETNQGETVYAINEALEELAERQMPTPERIGMYRQARSLWHNLRDLEKPGVIKGEDVSAQTLGNVLYRTDSAYRRGRSSRELEPIARYGNYFKNFPQSGTAPRSALFPLMGAAIGGGYGGFSGQDWVNTALMGAAAPYALGRAYTATGGLGAGGLLPGTRGLLNWMPSAGGRIGFGTGGLLAQ